MRRTDFRKSVATVLSAVAITLLCVPRVVFCIGTNGHIAIEPVGALCCHTAGSDADLLTRDSRCPAGCIDTPLGISLASRTPDPQDVPVPLAVAVAGALSHRPGGWNHGSAFHRVSIRTIVPPRSLRTTINLC
jgi:hypothetical protein